MPFSRGSRPLFAAVLALALVLTGAGSAQAFDWPRDPAERPTPETEVTTADAEAAIGSKLDSVLADGGLGPAFSLRVVDVESGRVIVDRLGTTPRIAASNTKLFTAVAALDVLGKDKRFTTKITRKGKSNTVALVGGGDMRITNGKLRSLATQTAAALRAKPPTKRVVRVRLDDSRYQGAATKLRTWRQGGYGLSTIQPIRSVMRTAVRSADAAASSAKYLRRQLAKQLGSGWTVRYVGRETGPRKAKTVAKVTSATVEALVARMLLVSDNQVAEGLHREIALARKLRPTFAAGARVATEVAAGYGVDMRKARLADGSGLSVRNTLTPRALTGVLQEVADTQNTALWPILFGSGALPVAGQTGTLAKERYYRFQQREAHCAVGQVVAKTGSLDWERALSGLTVGQDGRLKAFSVIATKLKTYEDRLTAVTKLDHVAAVVHGCARG